MEPQRWFHPQMNYFSCLSALNETQQFGMVQLKLSKKFLNTKFSRKEKDLSYRRAQAGAQCVLVEAPASGAGSARVRLAWAGRWTWACPHKSGQTCPKLSTGTAVSTPCSWKHTAEEQRVLSSCPSHCSVMNTQCFPTAQSSANLSDHVQAPGRTNTYSLNQ